MQYYQRMRELRQDNDKNQDEIANILNNTIILQSIRIRKKTIAIRAFNNTMSLLWCICRLYTRITGGFRLSQALISCT